METFFTSQKDVLFSNVEVKWNPALFYMHMYYFTCIGVGISNTHKFFVPESWFEFQALIFVFDGGGGGGGGGCPTTKKIMPPGKRENPRMSFVFFVLF